MKNLKLLLSASLWLAVVGLGVGALMVYNYTPGEDHGGAKLWPDQTLVPHLANHPTLVMFAHPKCPCTRATIGELALLMAQCQGQVDAVVVFFRPHDEPESWAHTDLWRSAEAIPGVTVRSDTDGGEAQRFEVTTSGHALLYDAQGKLIFSGGITASRGHSGDNAGRDSITALLKHELTFVKTTPTYGCSLLDPEACKKEVTWTR